MSNTRIRYIKTTDGNLESAQILVSHITKKEFKTVIDNTGKNGYILEMPNKVIVSQVAGTSPHKTKIALKKALKAFGVVFLNELRKKT